MKFILFYFLLFLGSSSGSFGATTPIAQQGIGTTTPKIDVSNVVGVVLPKLGSRFPKPLNILFNYNVIITNMVTTSILLVINKVCGYLDNIRYVDIISVADTLLQRW